MNGIGNVNIAGIVNNNCNSAVLSVYTKTWSRDSHGLYDYESTQTKNVHNQITENSVIVRKKLEIKALSTWEEVKEEEYLMNIRSDKPNSEKFFLSNPVELAMQPSEKNIGDLQNKIWYVIKHDESGTSNNQQFVNTNEDYYICLNDIVKLGRVKYAANEINIKKTADMMDVDTDIEGNTNSVTSSNPYNISSINYGTKPVFDFIHKSSTPPSHILEEITCKICLMGLSDEENPLVEMCKCTGGIKYTHYVCLKLWMQTKLSKKENEKKTVTSYNIKSFNCEICKTPFPFRFTINGNSSRIYDLIDIVRPENQNYIILESLNQLKDNNNLKSIHVISLDDQKITLGRGHESDVRINDISVSRMHASIIFDSLNGKICVRDLKSKFGTLVLMKNDFQVKDKKIHLQIGRTYLEVCAVNVNEQEKLKKYKEKKINSNNMSNNISSDLNNFQNLGSQNILSQLNLESGARVNHQGNYQHNLQSYNMDDFLNNEANLYRNQFIDLNNLDQLRFRLNNNNSNNGNAEKK